MAFELHRDGLQISLTAASVCHDRQPVKLSASSVDTVVPIGTNSERPFGMTNASIAQGLRGAIYEEGNYVKAVAAASMGFGAEVGIASDNGAFGLATMIAASGHWAHGICFQPAGVGETFTLYVKARKAT